MGRRIENDAGSQALSEAAVRELAEQAAREAAQRAAEQAARRAALEARRAAEAYARQNSAVEGPRTMGRQVRSSVRFEPPPAGPTRRVRESVSFQPAPRAINPDLIPAGTQLRAPSEAAQVTAASEGARLRAGLNPTIGETMVPTNAGYGSYPGTPFVKGAGDTNDISPNDVTQGQLGDCWLMSSLASLAQQDPERLRSMIRENGDGSYTVTLNMKDHRTGRFAPIEVQVSADLPLVNGQPPFAQPGDRTVQGTPELWVAIIEKAYARLKGSYAGIEGGWGEDALETLTGRQFDKVPPKSLSLDRLAAAHDAGSPITCSTLNEKDAKKDPLFQSGRLVASHEYWLESVDRAAGTVTLRNPWGYDRGPVTLSWAEFQRVFQKVSYSP